MAAYQYIYVMKDLTKAYQTGREVLRNMTLSFLPGAKIGVLGDNGAGKSTLLRIMAGIETEFNGEAWVAEGANIGYLSQEPQLCSDKTVAENVMEGLSEQKQLVHRFEAVSLKLGEVEDPIEMEKLIEEQAELQEKIDAANAWDLDRTIGIAMDALRCPPGDSNVETLSGGERRRVALCQLLLSKPDLLLLDEPTNHLDAETVAWLEHHLREYEGTVVMVTHDRYFLDNVTGWILELDRGQGIPYEGNYTAWLEQKEKRLRTETSSESARLRTLAREREWINSSPRARQAKSKARIQAYEKLLADSRERTPGSSQIIVPPGKRLGDLVIEIENLQKGYSSQLLIEDLTLKISPGAIVGIIGPNGAGKTTLFRMITGEEEPDEGELRIGESVQLGFVDQSRDQLDGDNNVWEEISQGEAEIHLGGQKIQSRAYVGAFNFRGPDQQKKIDQLSGGERNRVHLAKMLRSGANVLLLDEPTNDLDIDTLRALEEALSEFAGCILITSHDRWFLDRIATHILAYEGNSQVVWFEGNFQEYEADKKRRLGDMASQPYRIKYKPLTR